MAQSIAQAQRSALNSGFLNSLGSNPEFSDLALDETFAALTKLAGFLLEETNRNLNKGGHNSSGALSSSFKILDPKTKGKNLFLDIEALDYYQFLNYGVKGTKSGNGKFSFKSSFPSQKMVKDIEKWMKISKRSTRNIQKTVSKQESKQKSVSQLNAAYAVARSIKMKGIKGTGFFDKAVKATELRTKEYLGKALKIDIINSLPNNINGNNP